MCNCISDLLNEISVNARKRWYKLHRLATRLMERVNVGLVDT